jgi:hypothetical protein
MRFETVALSVRSSQRVKHSMNDLSGVAPPSSPKHTYARGTPAICKWDHMGPVSKAFAFLRAYC